jgi:hypothetical protein
LSIQKSSKIVFLKKRAKIDPIPIITQLERSKQVTKEQSHHNLQEGQETNSRTGRITKEKMITIMMAVKSEEIAPIDTPSINTITLTKPIIAIVRAEQTIITKRVTVMEIKTAPIDHPYTIFKYFSLME